ncbi:hypothetical protein O181_081764 [Austropuccinia psidii MF-1]|uniref:Tet-like 2OG-Fe(II) oxygenase domain-containing protein n=1 Tax=Austropuccinia psidii MF-1 TaxID=1389203 RepID=A0A9Q3IKF0_9BASI|nr:hypothetical protein [Austropuccinia psidii MF-1]
MLHQHQIGLEQEAVEYLASCLSKLKQHATQLSIEGGGADNEISTKPHKNLEDIMGYSYPFDDCVQHECKNLVEPVWQRTNKYICNLVNKSFFSSESFNPNVPLRFEFARCLVLHFGDAWVAKRVLGSSDEVTLNVPRPNVPVSFKRTRITRDPQQGAYCIRGCLRYSTCLDWKLIAWEHQYVKLNNALSTAIFRFRYLRSRICKGIYVRDWVAQMQQENEQFGLYGSVGKIEKAKDEWQNQGSNLSLVGCILGQSLRYFGDNLFEKIQNCYNSLGVWAFDQVNYKGDIPANKGACKFASALTLIMNGFKNSPHLDKDAFLYALGWLATMLTISYACAGSRQFTLQSLRL